MNPFPILLTLTAMMLMLMLTLFQFLPLTKMLTLLRRNLPHLLLLLLSRPLLRQQTVQHLVKSWHFAMVAPAPPAGEARSWPHRLPPALSRCHLGWWRGEQLLVW